MVESREAGPGAAALRLVFVALAWLGAFLLARAELWRLVPLPLAAGLSEQAYMSLVHLVSMAFGLALAWLVLPGPRAQLGWRMPSRQGLVRVLLLGPAVYVLVSYVAVLVALPTLLEEVRRGGRALAQSGSGEFGRSLAVASPAVLLVAYVVVAPVAEELLFRGALQTGLARLVGSWWRPAPHPEALARAFGEPRVARWLREGGLALLLTTAGFGWLHADGAGGLGIVRVASATLLGLACGLCRWKLDSVIPAIALHAVMNLGSLSTLRRWTVTEWAPTRLGVPTLTTALAAALALVALLLALRGRAGGGSDPSRHHG